MDTDLLGGFVFGWECVVCINMQKGRVKQGNEETCR